MPNITYKTSGVDIDKANVFVESIQGLMKGSFTPGVLKFKGAFGSLFELPKGYKNPVLVSSTDGVGTKLLLAQLLHKHDTVGIDLVAMNVNDVLCTGAKPLFFLDYIACGKLEPTVLRDVVKGIAAGCKEADCSLIGGETAEMPGMYRQDEYDLAGFCIGVVDKDKIINGSRLQPGDQLIGLPSSGLHSNGFSLVRKVLSAQEQKNYAKVLLAPTRIYVREVLRLMKTCDIKGIAHITGGAFLEKLTKILPRGQCFVVNKSAWKLPKIFQIIQEKGRIGDLEMYRTFNMGIGLVLVLDKINALRAAKFFRERKIEFYSIGKVVKHRGEKIIFEP